MTFQTLSFLFLLVCTFSLYWFLGRRMQNLLLLVASYVFYGYVDPWLAVLLSAFSLLMYASALGATPIVGEPAGRRQRMFLALGIAVAVGALGVFKFLGFFVESVGDFAEVLGLGTFSNHLNIILPVGISFYTLQALGYVIDVHCGKTEVRRDLLDFGIFISFFPQLVAGPIERASNLLPQFESRRRFSAEDAREGVTLLLWGFFKKLVIADNVGVIADNVFGLESPGFGLVWVGVLAFGLQIFADFSGYTDIARGTARLFGIKLSLNFNHPHMARSPVDFWRRWHISLSTWFRDYVYIPLGGSRAGRRRTVINIMVTFLLSGLWHGAAWNFLLWGAYHGGLVVVQRQVGSLKGSEWRIPRAVRLLQIPVTFALVSAGWILFRETDLAHTLGMLTASPFAESASDYELALFLGLQVAIYSIPVLVHTAVASSVDGVRGLAVTPWQREGARAVFAAGFFAAILLLRPASGGEFIYFQF
jgi:alginate O-acetyltransferase complex protein AlgI